MKHLIVAAHPVEGSFTLSLARAYADELERLGHTQRTYDLYRMGFNPLLEPHELGPAGPAKPVSADVLAAQEQIRTADVFTAIYPLWWLSMPAMMKGFIDRVFAGGFAYDISDGIVHGLLAGKKAVMITSSGASMASLLATGDWAAVQRLQDSHVFHAAGFQLIEHLHFDHVAPPLPRHAVEEHLERVRFCARDHFAPVAERRVRG